ncbi:MULTISPECIES: FAD-binding protein [unclassified Microbacterium]|uniref:FAD-binding oxidoreductase n=1 Tax=unclassified Microbacterium TaxID=2609290 RepID=UPI00214B510D|nr:MULTISPECIES: FAD-binding protein [unclassified Microbacterium]MCR2784314.1 FAD-binding protein [Microbacterium sp. zg.B96]MDL5350778.1 FAD-binding protein [Microbacterium sp. zg-YB36]WIM14859.1 FAD-binding protein [Microbacterium sp. zg-B96]
MTVSIDRIDQLRTSFAGPVHAPGDPAWDEARRYHAGIGSPDVVVRPSTVEAVRGAVVWAASQGVPVVVRGGGHSAWNQPPGGIVIDLADLRDVTVDRTDDGAIVHIGGGAVWGAVARELAARGLGISSGDTASVGVGGLTLGGGIGWMVRAWGLAADQLTGVQLVTASGEVVEATDASHPDLLWALRGGGGNFGVVTRFDFHAHELPALVHGTYAVAGDHAAVLRTLRDVLATAPRELTVTYMDVPAMDPSAPAGAGIEAVWLGDDPEDLRRLLEPVASIDGVTQTALGLTAYPDILLEMPAAEPEAQMPGFLGGNTLLDDLTDDAIARLVAFRAATDASVLFLRSLGGAYGDVAADATAWSARGATWFAMAGGFDIPGLVDDAERARLTRDWEAIEALGGGVYGNFAVTLDERYVTRMYPAATRARLGAIKREWDPANLFRRNHNVVPV